MNLETFIKHYQCINCQELDFGPDYCHLGSGLSIPDIRKKLENSLKVTGKNVRVQEIFHCQKQGQSASGCPVSKTILKKQENEEYLVLVKQRKGHICFEKFAIVTIVAWCKISKCIGL